MNVQRWIARSETGWGQLESLLVQAETKGLKSLKGDQVRQMASLYRSVSADLARAQSQQVGPAVIKDLQGLATRGYSQIYQGSRRQEWREAGDFIRYGFPEVVQESWGYIAIATALFFIGGAIGWWYAWQDDSFLTLVLGSEFVESVRSSRELWTVSILGQEPTASSSIMINNIIVSLNVMIGGITTYLPAFPAVTPSGDTITIPMLAPPGGFTVYALFFNGLMIGCVSALTAQVNLAYDLWAFVFPHGSLELPAIFFAGGAGLLLARAILIPGRYKRVAALKVYGLQAVKLLYGVIVMLVIAGIIEGFFSPQLWIPNEIKYLTGTIIFIALVQYCRRTRPVV